MTPPWGNRKAAEQGYAMAQNNRPHQEDDEGEVEGIQAERIAIGPREGWPLCAIEAIVGAGREQASTERACFCCGAEKVHAEK